MSVRRALLNSEKTIKALLLLFMALSLASCGSGAKNDAPSSKGFRGGETRPTLSPAAYSGFTADAYKAAQEIPEVLDSLYCHCDCEKNFSHKSLLSCFVDEHAVHCDICIYEALMAHDLKKKGVDLDTIRKAVDERFSNLRH